MAEHGRRRKRRKDLLSSISVLVVTAFAGYMLVANIELNGTSTQPSDTTELIENRQAYADTLTSEINDLSTKLDTARELNGNMTSWNVDPTPQDAGSDTMLPKVEGPGITVELDDSSLSNSVILSSGADVNDYLVHQQDIEAVVNALWAGDAEVMTIEGVRVENTTAVRCVGNVLLLNGHTYSPPYTIQAIGSFDDMSAALDNSPAIQLYMQYVREDGLGWKVTQESDLTFDKTTSSLQDVKYAKLSDISQLQAMASGSN